ncbi:MAG: ATP synthase F1 subunit gamma [Bacteroidales bacterium]|nr:ATP synthase F1 subunit gamma [Bacteroidales bacterium]
MASLKEIKGRIDSVKSTLKITSAMKMVASAKLHKAQNAIGNMVPYESRLREILGSLLGTVSAAGAYTDVREVKKVALVCFASNSSLCGAFNSNAIREANKTVAQYREAGTEITVFSVGRRMADAMRKAGYPSPADYYELSSRPSYAAASQLGEDLLQGFLTGKFDRVEFVYNHFKSTASQTVIRETYLPLSLESQEGVAQVDEEKFLVEPGKQELLEELLPKVIRLKIYTVLLDTIAAEHAARTVAMQTATDNGNQLLQDLTLEYNKGRQQKITNEILDIVSGSSV